MIPTLRCPLLPVQRLVSDALPRAARCGFAAIELPVAADTLESNRHRSESTRTIARAASALKLPIAGLSAQAESPIGLAGDAAQRRRGADLLRRQLQYVHQIGCPCITVTPARLPAQECTYADALAQTADCLLELRHKAEALGVTITLDHAGAQFLLSPVEAADLLDYVNSPCVGWRLSAAHVAQFGDPVDWTHTLAHRIHLVDADDSTLPPRPAQSQCSPSLVRWPSLISALREVRYDGPLITADFEHAEQAAERLRRLLGS